MRWVLYCVGNWEPGGSENFQEEIEYAKEMLWVTYRLRNPDGRLAYMLTPAGIAYWRVLNGEERFGDAHPNAYPGVADIVSEDGVWKFPLPKELK